MISKSIIKVIINTATKETKENIINELLNHISLNYDYDYNDNKVNHILEMLVDLKAVVKLEDVNVDYINSNPRLLIYNFEKYNIKNINVVAIDNIDCTVKVEYEYIEKINEDRDDISYTHSSCYINFLDNPDVLKK